MMNELTVNNCLNFSETIKISSWQIRLNGFFWPGVLSLHGPFRLNHSPSLQ